MDNLLTSSAYDNNIDLQRRTIEHISRSTINSEQRRSYTPRKLVHRTERFPFHENIKIKDESVATASLPGDSVYTQDATVKDYNELAAKYPRIARLMGGPPDESIYPDVDPKSIPLSEYGAQYGHDPHRHEKTLEALRRLITPSQEHLMHQSTNRYYHQDFRAPLWHSYPLQRPPMNIPVNNLGTSLGTNAGIDMSTEYKRTIGHTGSRILLDQYFGPSTVKKDCAS